MILTQNISSNQSFSKKKIKIKNNYIPFFEISYPDKLKKSYLLLTKHIISSKEFTLPKIVFDKLKKCKGIAFECHPFTDTAKIHSNAIDLLHEKITSKQQELNKLISDSKMLELDFSPAEKLLDHYNKLYNLSLKMKRIRNEMKGDKKHLIVSLSHLIFGLIYPKNCYFMENELLNVALENNKEVKALDRSIKIESKYIKGLSNDIVKTGIEILNNLVNPELFEYHKEIEVEMSNEYVSGDFSGTEKRSKYKGFKTNVIDRNKKWVPKIINNPEFLFVVGADHFSGKYGLKSLLEQKGYKLTPYYEKEVVYN